MAHIRQAATKAKDSLPQDKKAHPITVQLSRRSGRVASVTLWSSVVKGVGAGSTETPMTQLKGLSARYMRLMGKCNNSATRLWTDEDVETRLHTTPRATNHWTIA